MKHNNKKPLILITNDDGVHAKGIQCLIEVIKPLGEIVVLAPEGPRSGMSSAITPYVPLRIFRLKQEENLTVYSCTGTPVDCVKLAINEILDRKPDLVISGINHGSNAAICIIYSGTMGAALEGCIFGIPSFGVSLTDHSSNADFSEAVKYARIVAEKVLEEGLPKGICLNVNVPNEGEIKGMKICTQTPGRWVSEFMKSKDGSGKDIYWLTGVFENFTPDDKNTDEWALTNGYVSIVPSQIDLTAYQMVDRLKHWENA
ncbi:MAG: 5'/3'-nucleotidase SurE [Dysgonamonadaceae bacterium]|jgi:5'-nucleotidase|nr:5'/3'-nucleotidase SurE [Dysgonamonadaceae bacterium]